MICRISRGVNPYVQIDHRPLIDNRLSWKARGILAYLLTKPDHWEISITHLADQSPAGEEAVRSALKELRNFGYVELVKSRDEKGHIKGSEWLIKEVPDLNTQNHRDGGFPDMGFPASGKNDTSNKGLLVRKEEDKALLAKASTGTNSRESQPELDLGNDFRDSTEGVVAKKPISDKQDDFLWPRQRLMATLPGWKPRKSDKTDKAIKWFLKKHGRDEFDKLMRAVAESDFLMARNRFMFKGDGKTPHERKTPSFIFGVNDDGEKHSDLILNGYYSNENTATWWLPKESKPTSYKTEDFIKVRIGRHNKPVSVKKSDVGDKAKYLPMPGLNEPDGILTVMDQSELL